MCRFVDQHGDRFDMPAIVIHNIAAGELFTKPWLQPYSLMTYVTIIIIIIVIVI